MAKMYGFIDILKAEQLNKSNILLLSVKERLEEIENIVLNGGEDWGNWSEGYDKIENRLPQIHSVLEYYKCRNEYLSLKNVWMSLNRFSDLYGHWDFRLKWLRYISNLALINHDINYYFSTLVSIAWTYTMQANFLQAEKTLNIAHKIIDKVDNELLKFSFFHCLFVFTANSLKNKREESYEFKLKEIINSQKALLKNLRQSDSIDVRQKKRLVINYLRNFAKFYYLKKDLNKAKKLYFIVLKESKSINFLRGASYAHNKLADIYIDISIECSSKFSVRNSHENIKKAREHIEDGKIIASTNKNKRRMAGLYLSEARIMKFTNDKTEDIKKKCDLARENAVPLQEHQIEITTNKLLSK